MDDNRKMEAYLKRILLNQASIMTALADTCRTVTMNKHLTMMTKESIKLLEETK